MAIERGPVPQPEDDAIALGERVEFSRQAFRDQVGNEGIEGVSGLFVGAIRAMIGQDSVHGFDIILTSDGGYLNIYTDHSNLDEQARKREGAIQSLIHINLLMSGSLGVEWTSLGGRTFEEAAEEEERKLGETPDRTRAATIKFVD